VKTLRYLIALAFVALTLNGAHAAATLLPNGEQCFQALAPTSGGPGTTGTGFVGLLGPIVGGSGGTSGTYGGVALTGGSGTGVTANITVSGGAVTAVAILNPGSQYVVGDVLTTASGNIGNVTGFSISVSSVYINQSLAGGTVTYYYPNTTTYKQTWFNSDQAAIHQNTNPVQLDANGCAVVYGTGSYRQILKDSLGNTIWDQTTTDTSAYNSTFWAGLAAGTPNAITVTDPGFNATDGTIINFIAISTNTGATTLTPSGIGPYSILKSTTAGPVSLTGGEIVQNNVISVIYSESNAAFILLNTAIQSPSGSSAPLCGAVGFVAINDTGTPNTSIDITSTSALTISSTGLALNRSNVSLTLNLQTNGINGLDTGSLTANTIYNIWLIDNGAAIASLASTSYTAPTLPSGYTYKCRVGTITSTAGSILPGFVIRGNATNITNSAIVVHTVTGGNCNGANYQVLTISQLPITATQGIGNLIVIAGQVIAISQTQAVTPYLDGTGLSGSASLNIPFIFSIITPQQVTYCSTSTSNSFYVNGWYESVNVH